MFFENPYKFPFKMRSFSSVMLQLLNDIFNSTKLLNLLRQLTNKSTHSKQKSV